MTLLIHSLGSVQISRDGDPIDIPGYRPLALLAYLLVTGEAHSRQHLVDLLFEGSDDPRASLRWTLSKLRSAIGADYLLADRQEIAFNFESDYWLDVTAFEAGQIDLYRGDFLEGLGVRDAYRFEDWLFFERERLRSTYQAALSQRLEECESHGDYPAVVETAHQLLRLDNLHEDWYRALMRAYARLGKREAALAQYAQCRQVLEEELGVEPAGETRSLYEQIQAGALEVSTPALVRPPDISPKPPAFLEEAEEQVVSERPVFVARERELARLDEYLTAALEGQGRVVFITGEAGRGKTALLTEFAHRAQEAHSELVVASGNCNAHTGVGDPYLPFRDVMGMLSGDVESRWAAGTITREHACRLWILLSHTVQALVDDGPDVIDVFVSGVALARRAAARAPGGASWQKRLKELAGREKAVPGDLEQRQLFEQYTQVLCTLAAHHPLLLMLDDLQWADGASINLLFHLGRRLGGRRILILGAYRPSEVALGRPSAGQRGVLVEPSGPQQHPLMPVINEFKRLFGDIHVDLGQITPAEGREFVDTLLDTEPNRLGEDFRQALFRHTRGHPLFTIELLRDMQERGDLIQDEEGRWIGGPTLVWDALPARVEAMIEGRLGRLEDELRDILTVASVEGEDFTAQVVARVQQISERRLLRRLSQELEKRHRLVRERGEVRVGRQRLSRYRFGHVLFQQYLYNGLSLGERRLLHGEIAALLEEVYEGHTDEIAVQLARHYVEAGEGEKAVDYLLQAGDQARRLDACREAIDYYRRALALLKEQGEHQQAARTLMKLGLTYHTAFDFKAARQAYEEGFVLWQQVGEIQPTVPPPPAPHALRVNWRDPVTLDSTMAHDTTSGGVIGQLFSGLAEWSPEMEVMPDLARSWDVSEGARRYVFHLRDDVRWSDGAPVTAGDFEYAWKRTLDPATGSPGASLLYDIKGARAFHQGEVSDPDRVGVRALDEVTLVVELELPASYFLHLVADSATYPVPQHAVEACGEARTEVGNIVTNGPFRLEIWQRGESLVLMRNPEYHGRFGGNIQRVELCLLSDLSATLQMYEADDLDILQFPYVPLSEIDRARQQRAGEYVSTPWLHTKYVGLDVSRPPFDDVRVRRAFALATDRETLAEVVLRGYCFPAAGGFVPRGMPGHSAGIGLPYDPGQARQLLAEAGYPRGCGFPGVESLTGQFFEPYTEYLQAQWRENLGVEITWETMKGAAYFDRLNRKPPHMYFTGWIADYPDPDNYLRLFSIRRWSRWRNKTYDRLIEEARSVIDQGKRVKLYQQADRILVNEAVIVPLTYLRRHLLAKPWVRKYPTSALKEWFLKDVIIEPH